ncbi:galactose-1-phosphate uridylyltransferase [Schizopora paradoxa]|uniref:Galactose-1-phosphate uridylyltransferase n=1 Tax=Schizopora paradoxa TaxID=27342 RepID=A0A0H2RTC0_9AGAM|nr:galactose-1-phosphate uridylyltransferase [Schizopora paradoxa]
MDDLVFDPSSHTHRRYNPLIDEYVLVSPHRNKRPWLGQTEPPQQVVLPEFDPACYLCPGNKRAGGQSNPRYTKTFVFENDFSALPSSPIPTAPSVDHPLLRAEPIHGSCDVVVFHPRHDVTLARMSLDGLLNVVEEWKRVYEYRSSKPGIKYVQIFENKGSMMGCSNPHPHSQVWSLSEIPSIAEKELRALTKYSLSEIAHSDSPRPPNGNPCLLCEYAHFEANTENGPRVVAKTNHWIALVPWWAVWPFEVLLLPYRRHICSISELTPEETACFAQILSEVTVRYDNLFSCSFAYSMGIHQSPISSKASGDIDTSIAHLHVHLLPPLLRSASVRKFLVGFELMAEPQRDLTPEQGAARLRECSSTHYLSSI